MFEYRGSDIAYILLYVDDIILTASSDDLRRSIMALLSAEFAMKDLGPLSYFLGIAVTRNADGLFLSQNPGTGRPYISYAVQQVCLHMHDPRNEHMAALKRILRYIQGSIDFGLHIYKSTVNSLVSYTDADWGGCPDNRHSTSGYCVFLGDNLISWSSKRQPTFSRSSAEAEYRGVANVVSESCWIRNLLLELHCSIQKATLVYCDNVSAIYLSGNPVQHQRTKHIEMDIHFVREKVARGELYIFTLVNKVHLQFWSLLCSVLKAVHIHTLVKLNEDDN
ncbi:uncharacterized mitochondrial protein AtMg00810-like [Lycium barbarum]|uniref:uncharacterized mitochondrial protein AtMg00810-like n=1 Tax=Lycium barbarum TaxID=112863 RepID=UPI00293F46A5|nr:uncharacterized mitochondrial protein AtMg00810-like [Lycium barbarum]